MEDQSRHSENPFLSPSSEAAAPDASGAAQIAIADLLFCTLAVSLCLMIRYQRWGGYEESVPITSIVIGITIALSASVFFTANRLRRLQERPFYSMAPGHFISLVGAGTLTAYIFQYLVSFLDIRQVGTPIHTLARLSPALSFVGICIAVLYGARLTPRWKAVFVAIAAYGVIQGLGVGAEINGSRSDFTHPMNVAAYWMWRLGGGAGVMVFIFLLIAYVSDLVAGVKRDWLHHAGVLIALTNDCIGSIEGVDLRSLLWLLYDQFVQLTS